MVTQHDLGVGGIPREPARLRNLWVRGQRQLIHFNMAQGLYTLAIAFPHNAVSNTMVKC
jgi:hypothetical protein